MTDANVENPIMSISGSGLTFNASKDSGWFEGWEDQASTAASCNGIHSSQDR